MKKIIILSIIAGIVAFIGGFLYARHDKDYMELETELIDAYIKAEVLAGVEGMKLMQGLNNGTIEQIA